MTGKLPTNIIVRPSGVLIEDGRLLLLRQAVTAAREWSLPGGALEPGETIEQCLVREIKEETGLEVRMKALLYVTDRYRGQTTHVVHMSFLVERTGTKPLPAAWSHHDPAPSGAAGKRREVRMVPVTDLTSYGFPVTFQRLVAEGFPGKGSYQGDYNEFYGEAPDER